MAPPPRRTCVGCGREREKNDLLRLAIDGRSIRVDPKGRLPGRGVYVCRDEACVLLAQKRHALARWAAADAEREVLEAVRGLIGASGRDRDAALLGLVGLARKAGEVEVGLRGSLERLKRGEGFVLVTARDISERGAREAVKAAGEADVPLVVAGTRETLGGELGSNEVVAALLLGREMARGLLAAAHGEAGRETDGTRRG
jgi:predicted RNA-binding protein YlxR (DUF448 family)/ribosomal protein L7Ae-like RNA K-turn-binding protein